jgi:Domain of unknown function (DUF4136)
VQKYSWFVILTMVFIFWGCSTLKVSQDYDIKAKFSGLKTYVWQSETHKKTGDVRVDNPLLHSRIRSAVDFFLLSKGYRIVSKGTPDFYVNYQYSIRTKVDSNNLDGGVGFGIGTYGRHGGIGISTGGSVSTYDEGMLVIDILASGSKDLIWRGTATRRISQHSNPEKTTKNVNEAVEKILAQFPP